MRIDLRAQGTQFRLGALVYEKSFALLTFALFPLGANGFKLPAETGSKSVEE